jgi:hypothetical protein
VQTDGPVESEDRSRIERDRGIKIEKGRAAARFIERGRSS